jgi:hypothetical protein
MRRRELGIRRRLRCGTGYEGLKSLARRALHRAANAEELSLVEAGWVDSERHREVLAEVLSMAEVDGNEELVDAARRLLELTGHVEAGKYQGVVVRDNKGVQVGDHNTQTNTFTC